MLKLLSTFATGALLALSTLACQFDPYSKPIVPGIDDVKAAKSEMPSDAELVNKKSTVVVMPTQVEAGVNDPGLHSLLTTPIISAINGAGTLRASAGGANMNRIIDQHKLQGSALFSAQGGAKLGKLMKADYVAWLTVNTMHGTIEGKVYQRKDGSTYREWDGEGSANVTLTMVNVETGAYKIQSAMAGTYTETFEARPVGDHYTIMGRKAAQNAVRDLEPVVGAAFPAFGYIKQLRGERSVALVEVPGVTSLQLGTVVKVFVKRSTSDPRTGATSNTYVPIGSMTVRLVDRTGIWCAVNDGSDVIRLGHPVSSAGKEARGWLDKFLD